LSKYREIVTTLRDWTAVSFPYGLAIRPPRERLDSRIHRFTPIPRQWQKKHNILKAEQAVLEASQVKAPPQRLLSREDFIKQSRRVIRTKRNPIISIEDFLPYFPVKNAMKRKLATISKFVRRRVRAIIPSLVKAVRACLLSGVLFAFLGYTSSMIWQWQHLSATFCAGSSAIGSSLMRFGAVFTRAYSVGCGNTFFVSALGFAPIAHKGLKSLSYRLRAKSDTKVLIRITSLLTLFHFGIVAALFLTDAAVLNSVYHREILYLAMN